MLDSLIYCGSGPLYTYSSIVAVDWCGAIFGIKHVDVLSSLFIRIIFLDALVGGHNLSIAGAESSVFLAN